LDKVAAAITEGLDERKNMKSKEKAAKEAQAKAETKEAEAAEK